MTLRTDCVNALWEPEPVSVIDLRARQPRSLRFPAAPFKADRDARDVQYDVIIDPPFRANYVLAVAHVNHATTDPEHCAFHVAMYEPGGILIWEGTIDEWGVAWGIPRARDAYVALEERCRLRVVAGLYHTPPGPLPRPMVPLFCPLTYEAFRNVEPKVFHETQVVAFPPPASGFGRTAHNALLARASGEGEQPETVWVFHNSRQVDNTDTYERQVVEEIRLALSWVPRVEVFAQSMFFVYSPHMHQNLQFILTGVTNMIVNYSQCRTG